MYIEFVAYKEEYEPEMADGVVRTFEEYATPDVVITADSAKVRSEAGLSGDLHVDATNGQTGYVHKGVATIR